MFSISASISNPVKVRSIFFVFTCSMFIPDFVKIETRSDKTPILFSVLTLILAVYRCGFLESSHIAGKYLGSLLINGETCLHCL